MKTARLSWDWVSAHKRVSNLVLDDGVKTKPYSLE